jgi:hypothetical protein
MFSPHTDCGPTAAPETESGLFAIAAAAPRVVLNLKLAAGVPHGLEGHAVPVRNLRNGCAASDLFRHLPPKIKPLIVRHYSTALAVRS